MKQPVKVEYKTKEAAFLSRIIGLFKDEIKSPVFSALAVSLGSLIKAIDVSKSLQKTFTRIFNFIKEYWEEEK